MLRRVINPILLFPLTLSINTVDVLSSETKNYIDNVLEEKSNITFVDYQEIEKLVSLRSSENSIKLFYDKGQVVYISSNQIITTRTLEGTYPNYSQLIPDSFSKILNFNTKKLIDSLERIAVLADQQSSVVKIKLDDTDLASISADAQDIGNANEAIPVSYSGENFDIAFNVRYLLEGLKVIASENVLLKCNIATTPAVFVPEDNLNSFTYLVMPVQVRS